MSVLAARVAIAQATLDHWQGLIFRLGEIDCARLFGAHARRMGHRVRLPAKGSYRTPKSAAKELATRGYADLHDALDQMGFERIAPASTWPGDVVALPSDMAAHPDAPPIGTLAIVLSNGRVVGWHGDLPGATVLQPLEYVAAWRIPLKGKAADVPIDEALP